MLEKIMLMLGHFFQHLFCLDIDRHIRVDLSDDEPVKQHFVFDWQRLTLVPATDYQPAPIYEPT